MSSAVEANATNLTPLFDLLPGFSYPQDETRVGLDTAVPLIVREYAAGLVGAYAGRRYDELAAGSDGLLEYLGRWAADPETTPTDPDGSGWDYCYGDAYRSLMNGGYDACQVAASVAARLGACGVTGAWSVELSQPLRLRWGDCLLPPATQLSVHSGASEATIEHDGPAGSGVANLRREDGLWQGDRDHARRRVARHGTSFEVLVREALAMRDYEDLIGRALEVVPERMYQVFDEALDIIATYTPQYLPWTARAIHQMFLLSPSPGRVESGSVEHYLGLVHLSLHNEPLPVAELLV